MTKTNNSEQIFQMTEIDLTIIKKNPEYLIFKLRGLDDRDKEDILDYINLKIVLNRRIKSKENVCTSSINEHEDNSKVGKVIPFDFLKKTL